MSLSAPFLHVPDVDLPLAERRFPFRAADETEVKAVREAAGNALAGVEKLIRKMVFERLAGADHATMEDVYQDACLELWRYSIPRYDRSKATKFSTFVVRCASRVISDRCQRWARDRNRYGHSIGDRTLVARDVSADRAVEETAAAVIANPDHYFTTQQAKVLKALFAAGPDAETTTWSKDLGYDKTHSASAQVSRAVQKVKQMDPYLPVPKRFPLRSGAPEPAISHQPTPEQLREMYEVQLMSTRTIAARYGTTKSTVLTWLKHSDIPQRHRNLDGWALVTKEQLAALWNSDNSLIDISVTLGISMSSLRRYARHYKLPGKAAGPKSKLIGLNAIAPRTLPPPPKVAPPDPELVEYLATVADGAFGSVLGLIPVNSGNPIGVASHLARIARDSVQLFVLDTEAVDLWLGVLEKHGWITGYEFCADTWPVIVAARPGVKPQLPHDDEGDFDRVLNVLLRNTGPGPVLIPYGEITAYVALRCIGSQKPTTVLLRGKRGISGFINRLKGTNYATLSGDDTDRTVHTYTHDGGTVASGADGESSPAQQYHNVGETNAY